MCSIEEFQRVGDFDDLVWCQKYIIALETEVERLKGLLAVKAVHQVAVSLPAEIPPSPSLSLPGRGTEEEGEEAEEGRSWTVVH